MCLDATQGLHRPYSTPYDLAFWTKAEQFLGKQVGRSSVKSASSVGIDRGCFRQGVGAWGRRVKRACREPPGDGASAHASPGGSQCASRGPGRRAADRTSVNLEAVGTASVLQFGRLGNRPATRPRWGRWRVVPIPPLGRAVQRCDRWGPVATVTAAGEPRDRSSSRPRPIPGSLTNGFVGANPKMALCSCAPVPHRQQVPLS